MIQTIQLTPGVVLRHYPDKRFKTAVLSVQFQRPLCREEAALNALLSILCLQIGFSATTFSFDAQNGLKTATEVVSENSKTYKTIKTVQNQLRPMLEHMVRNIIDVAILYGMEWQGQSVESLAAGGYEVKITFDDGVTQDRQTNLNEGVMLVNSGLLSKFTFLTDRKYGQGMTEKDALAELERLWHSYGVYQSVEETGSPE